MLANGSFVSYFFSRPPLNMWRQVIWIIGLFILFNLMQRTKSSKLRSIFDIHGAFSLFVIFSGTFTIIFREFNLLRIGYAIWLYFAGFPFIVLPILIVYSRQSRKIFTNFLAYSGLFFAIGLILDYYLGGFFTLTFNEMYRARYDVDNSDSEFYRYCFTAEAPTTFSVLYNLQMLCFVWKLHTSNSSSKTILYLFSITLFIIGAWFTGSRQLLIILVITLVIALSYELFFIRGKKKNVVLLLLFLAILAPFTQDFINKDDVYRERFEINTIREDTRAQKWERGLIETILDPKVLLLGNGVGYTQNQKALNSEEYGSHYENSFFARISDIGIIGFLLMIYPAFYVLVKFSKKKFADVMLAALMLSYLIICFVSPNGSSPTTQTAVYLGLGLFICRRYFFVETKKRKNIVNK